MKQLGYASNMVLFHGNYLSFDLSNPTQDSNRFPYFTIYCDDPATLFFRERKILKRLRGAYNFQLI